MDAEQRLMECSSTGECLKLFGPRTEQTTQYLQSWESNRDCLLYVASGGSDKKTFVLGRALRVEYCAYPLHRLYLKLYG